jgi:hypothetical protein
LEEDHSEGLDLERLMKFRGYDLDLPIRNISKLNLCMIYDHQVLTLDGKYYLLKNYFNFLLGVLDTAGAATGNTLEILKRTYPLLVFEVLPELYCLIDGNHRMVIQFDDVSILIYFVFF